MSRRFANDGRRGCGARGGRDSGGPQDVRQSHATVAGRAASGNDMRSSAGEVGGDGDEGCAGATGHERKLDGSNGEISDVVYNISLT